MCVRYLVASHDGLYDALQPVDDAFLLHLHALLQHHLLVVQPGHRQRQLPHLGRVTTGLNPSLPYWMAS